MDFGDHGEVAAIATIRGMCIPFFLIGFDGLQNFQLSFAGAWMNDASSGKFKIPVRQFQRIDVVRKLIGIESYANEAFIPFDFFFVGEYVHGFAVCDDVRHAQVMFLQQGHQEFGG